MDIEDAAGNDNECLEMLEAAQTFSECEENQHPQDFNPTQQPAQQNTGVYGNLVPNNFKQLQDSDPLTSKLLTQFDMNL